MTATPLGGIAEGMTALYGGTNVGNAPVPLAAAGSTIGTATQIPTGITGVWINNTTASTAGVRLPEILAFLAAGGTALWVIPKATVGNKVYPTSGQGINAIATSGSITVASAKPGRFIPVGGGYGGSSALRWVQQKGG